MRIFKWNKRKNNQRSVRKLSSKGGGIRGRKENQIYTGHKPSVKLFFSRSIKGSEKDPCRVELHEVKTEEGERREKKRKKWRMCIYKCSLSNKCAHILTQTNSMLFHVLVEEEFIENNRFAASGYYVKSYT